MRRMCSRSLPTLIGLAWLWGLPACGGARAVPAQTESEVSRPVAQFPTAERLVAVLELGPPPDLAAQIAESTAYVEQWELQATPAPGDPEYTPEGPFEPLLDAAAAELGRTPVRSASLRCVAQEAARFSLEHGAWPSDRVTSFLLAACGSSSLTVAQAGSRGTIDRRASVDELVRQAGSDLQAAIAQGLTDDGPVGLGFARQGDQVVLVLVRGARPMMRVEPTAGPGADDEVIVRGRLMVEGSHGVVAAINQGAYGVATCRLSPATDLPHVELRCPMAPGDDTALLHIRTVTMGRVLTRHVASVLVRRTPESSPVFDGSAIGGAAPVADPGVGASILVERLNAIRAQEGLGPLVLSPSQSEVSQQVTPYLLGTQDPEALDVLGLGLLAGWRLESGIIRWGDIVGSVAIGQTDAAFWLSEALSNPTGRGVLMREDARTVAVGAAPIPERDAIGFVVSTYAFYEGLDHRAEAARLFERITRERTERGLPPPRRMEGLQGLETHAAAVAQGRETAQGAFQAALNEEGARLRRQLRGVVIETLDLEGGTLPAPVFERRELSVGIAVSHTQAPGAAWGQYVVFLIFG